MSTQPSFFGQSNEDLPLVSGTAPRAKVSPFIPKIKPKQETIKAQCPACLDTGQVAGKDCWCKPKLEERQRKAALIEDAFALSSGTIANLINDRRYEVIDSVHHDFIEWIETQKNCSFKNWRQAWDAYHPKYILQHN